ncbi:MAG TPA: S9 family peptidase [Acidobacteriota bacterium]|nr:S9 family peptidase [Acidobacteriota bacterium]
MTAKAVPRGADYGTWPSPITSKLIATHSIRLGQIALSGKDVYWVEGRPTESGRNVIVRGGAGGSGQDVNPSPLDARTRVHEYGGGAMLVDRGRVYFSHFADQRLYRCRPGRQPAPVTPEGPWRYADAVADPDRDRLICILEDHSGQRPEPANAIAAIDLAEGDIRVIEQGNDFYSDPRLSPDGMRLAWLTWNHPDMPWDGTELWVAEVGAEGELNNRRLVAGGPGESVLQPEWSPQGQLYFISDRDGWWNLFRQVGSSGSAKALLPMQAEFAHPRWLFGQSTYAFESADCLVCSYTRDARWSLARLDTQQGTLETLDTPYSYIAEVRAAPGRVVLRASSATEPESIVELDMATGRCSVLKRSFQIPAEFEEYFSIPQHLTFPTDQGRTAYGLFYPPRNPRFQAPPEQLPPLIVVGHGGPTSASSCQLSLETQYWTSRGFSLFEVNYGGSTGYGRAYRERLKGGWGIVDVDDCVNAARYLIDQGKVDGDKTVIKGGSAGGYTALAALVFRNLFKLGVSYYGVCDLEHLLRFTHKFESHYLEGLIGPYPKRRDLYRERSPLHFADRLSVPVIFFQGSEDKVVPPDQAEQMVAALRDKGSPVEYLLFEGEQHGFLRSETIERSLRAEADFYNAHLIKSS